MSRPPFEISEVKRYVAIGDSQTEGLHDYHAEGLPRGWADRFAEHLANAHPELLYANLAVRGKKTREILENQLAPALALAPDLATVVSGVNDVLQPKVEVEAIARDIETMYEALSDAGCRVMGCTFPLPRTGLTRKVAPRLQALNAELRMAADRHGVLLVELEPITDAADLRLWAADRIHLNSNGHERLAAAFDAAFHGHADSDWMRPLPPAPAPSPVMEVASETMWIARFLVPKVIRMLRGRSSGDDRSAKRPELRRVDRG